MQFGRRYLYVASDNDGHVKVGISTTPEFRIRALRSPTKRQPVLRAIKLGTVKQETELHAKLKRWRCGGAYSEWYRDCRGIRAVLASQGFRKVRKEAGPRVQVIALLSPSVWAKLWRVAKLNKKTIPQALNDAVRLLVKHKGIA